MNGGAPRGPTMEQPDITPLIQALRDLLGPRMAKSEPLRRTVRELGRLLIAEADRAGRAEPAAPEPSEIEASAPEPSANEPAAPEPSDSGAPAARPEVAITGPRLVSPEPKASVPLRLGDAGVSVRVFGRPEEVERARASVEAREAEEARESEPAAELDLALIETRSRLKAEACRVFIERRACEPGSEEERAQVERLQGLIDRARAMRDCFLWMLYREKPAPDDGPLALIGRWYDALASGAALVRRCDEGPASGRAELIEAMRLLAHASSGLRAVLEATWLTKPDSDQDEAHLWLRWQTGQREILLDRHMRLDDPAEPESIDALEEALARLEERVSSRERRAKEARGRLDRIRYHAGILAEGRSVNEAHDWQRIEESVEGLSGLGFDPEEDAVASRLEALAESGLEPPEGHPAAARALEAVRRVAATPEPEEGNGRARWSDRVRRVREMLRGGRLVIIGGEPRREAVDRIRDAFGVADVDWVALTEHGSGAAMRAPIERPETTLVVVLVKLAGHLHVDEARRYAKRADKPVVLLKAGYNPERLALGVMNQASEQLSSSGQGA